MWQLAAALQRVVKQREASWEVLELLSLNTLPEVACLATLLPLSKFRDYALHNPPAARPDGLLMPLSSATTQLALEVPPGDLQLQPWYDKCMTQLQLDKAETCCSGGYAKVRGQREGKGGGRGDLGFGQEC